MVVDLCHHAQATFFFLPVPSPAGLKHLLVCHHRDSFLRAPFTQLIASELPGCESFPDSESHLPTDGPQLA